MTSVISIGTGTNEIGHFKAAAFKSLKAAGYVNEVVNSPTFQDGSGNN